MCAIGLPPVHLHQDTRDVAICYEIPPTRFFEGRISAGAAVMAPTIIPSSALGLGGSVAPSERIVLGGIGIGNRGTYDLGCFLEQKDVQFVAACDVKETRRVAAKKKIDEHHGNQNCKMYRDFREVLDRPILMPC